MAAAAKHLTPVTLELGGKSTVIVDKTANVPLAAKRIAQGKWAANAGQVCISPDYVLVDRAVEAPLLDALPKEANEMLGASKAAHRFTAKRSAESFARWRAFQRMEQASKRGAKIMRANLLSAVILHLRDVQFARTKARINAHKVSFNRLKMKR